MKKFSLCLLCGVFLSQIAFAQKATIYNQAADPRHRVTEQNKLKSKDLVGTRNEKLELIKVSQAKIIPKPLMIKERILSEEQLKERDGLIEKYSILAKERQYEDAKMVAEILLSKYDYQVDTSLLTPSKAEAIKLETVEQTKLESRRVEARKISTIQVDE